MHVKTSLGNATRQLFLSSIMKQSGNYLPLTNREKTMIKWFFKFSFAVCFLVSSWVVPGMAIKSHLTHVEDLEIKVSAIDEKIVPTGQNLANLAVQEVKAEEYTVVSKTLRTVTAYNLGDVAQTDDSPCIGASNKNLCEMQEQGVKIAAANFVPFGTRLRIHGEIYEVWDRMNSKYPNRVDIAMSLAEKERALKFGKQILEVEILK